MRAKLQTELIGGPLDGLAITVAANANRIEIVHPSYPAVRSFLAYEPEARRDARDGTIRVVYQFAGRVPIAAAGKRGA